MLDQTVMDVTIKHYREVLYLNVTLLGVKFKCYRVRVYARSDSDGCYS